MQKSPVELHKRTAGLLNYKSNILLYYQRYSLMTYFYRISYEHLFKNKYYIFVEVTPEGKDIDLLNNLLGEPLLRQYQSYSF